MNALFADEGIAYRFELGRIVRRGTEEFREAVTEARHALNDERFQEVLRQFDRACEFRNQIPPDWANAIKEAANSVEGVLQVIYERPGVALTSIQLPGEVPKRIKEMFRSLYGLGSGIVGGRHASIEGVEATGPRADLAIHLAAALHAFAVAELDRGP